MRGYGYNQDKLEFRQIVLKHLQKILEISSSELRLKKTYIKDEAGNLQLFSEEDTRCSYIQSIENLAFILIPYFDDNIKKVYEESMKIINFYNHQIEEEYKEEIEEITKLLKNEKINMKSLCLDKKIEKAKELFIAINLLLKRNDYLKSSVYGDDMDDIVDDEEDYSSKDEEDGGE